MEERLENIRDLLLDEEMKDSYLTYAMSVIVQRALPDVRDGLKPSQRRILAAMNDLNLGPRSKFRKCAKIAGDTSGNYHPHGEQVIYPTLVRMAQDFACRYPLIDGQGNFGSIDGDPPAAMRYTEARLAYPSMEMLTDLNLDTVDFVSNYDETRMEPSVLPSKYPNLLCNGSSGIAVGMATSIPPHNLSEVASGIIALIENPKISVNELMKHIPGPDFPTGALICGSRGIREAYHSGRGIISLRARAHVEKKGKKVQVVFTEIPYQLNKTRIIEKIAGLVKEGRIAGISDVRDESDKEGIRLVVEVKRGEDENVILNQLYNYSPLQDSFSINMIALVNGRPELLGLKELIEAFRDHRIEVIRRRTLFLLNKAEQRAHVVEGLRIALARIDEVIETIKRSHTVEIARAALMENFGLTEIQANAILEMRLQKLTGLEVEKLEEEYKKLQEEISSYRAILADENLILDIIREDCYEIKERYGDARRTEIVGEVQEFDMEDLIAEEDVAVTLSHAGYIKRIPLSTYRKQGRGGKGITGADTREGDFIEHIFIASTHDYILFFTDKGKVHWLKVYDVPQLSRLSTGRALVNLLDVQGETITSMIPLRELDSGDLVMATQKGMVKKVNLRAFSRPKKGGIWAIKLKEGDRLIRVKVASPGQDLILGSQSGMAIRFNEKEVRRMGRTAAGVGGMRLRKGDAVKGLVVVEGDGCLLTVCENGYGKRTPFSYYRTQARNGRGIIDIKANERNGKVVALKGVKDGNEIVVITSLGMVIRMGVDQISSIGRNTQGVRVVSLKEGDKVVSVALVPREEAGRSGEETGNQAFPGEEASPGEEEATLDEEEETSPEEEGSTGEE